MRNTLVALLLVAGPLWADEAPLTAAEFEALVTGQTLTYSDGIGPFGAEEYLEDRRVRWSYLDGECQDGYWYESGSQICFAYEEIEAHQCWSFFYRGGRLTARFENDPAATELYETARATEPLLCLGPRIGV